MSEGIKPALTPEEWADYGDRLDEFLSAAAANARLQLAAPTSDWTGWRNRALAALLLRDIGFFTWEDVDLLRRLMVESDAPDIPGAEDRLPSLADRIAALLPPREP